MKAIFANHEVNNLTNHKIVRFSELCEFCGYNERDFSAKKFADKIQILYGNER